ncbi:MAG: RusA family crossover junction endodeoxyribonuclease [Eubacterium sp.]|nr:RusA family crossover junction endodeoxyribonuclease [Candidatus Colimonas fimequi]
MQITIPGPPQGKARARTFYNPRLGKHTSVTPSKTVLYENLIKTCYLRAHEGECYEDEPLEVIIRAWYEIPKSTSKKDRERIRNDKLYPTKKPDADNIAKVVCDALNGMAYKDDKQIVNMTVLKRYAENGEPHVDVIIMPLLKSE